MGFNHNEVADVVLEVWEFLKDQIMYKYWKREIQEKRIESLQKNSEVIEIHLQYRYEAAKENQIDKFVSLRDYDIQYDGKIHTNNRDLYDLFVKELYGLIPSETWICSIDDTLPTFEFPVEYAEELIKEFERDVERRASLINKNAKELLLQMAASLKRMENPEYSCLKRNEFKGYSNISFSRYGLNKLSNDKEVIILGKALIEYLSENGFGEYSLIIKYEFRTLTCSFEPFIKKDKLTG